MGDYKLYYFNIRGRAEPIRLTFAAAGKKYEDVQLTQEQWPAEKPKTPCGSLPYLQYKGKKYGESKAIAAFIAKECGMAGKNSAEEMCVSAVYCQHGSLLEAFTKVMFAADDAAKAAAQEAVNAQIPVTLGMWETMAKESGKGYIVGSSLSQADLSVYDITESLLKVNPQVLADCPEIVKSRGNVEKHAKVKTYLASRPASDF